MPSLIPNATITKQVARDAQVGHESVLIQRITIAIGSAARKGEVCCSVDVQNQPEAAIEAIMRLLKQEGYEVKRDRGSDPRDSTGWDSLGISW